MNNAHRVLRATGQVSPGWESSQGDGPDRARAMLEAEGVTFDDAGVADVGRRWTPDTSPLTSSVGSAMHTPD